MNEHPNPAGILRFIPFLAICAGMMNIAVWGQTPSLAEIDDEGFIDLLRRYRQPTESIAPESGQIHPITRGGKCGFALSAEVTRRFEISSPAVADEIRSLLAPAARQTSILSPSGLFRINYDTSGTHAAALLDAQGDRIPNSAHAFARRAAEFFDSAYQMEVAITGYEAPPFEESLTSYQVYIRDFGPAGDFGVTVFGLPRPRGTVRPTYASYIEIDNDYRGYRTPGLAGLAATAAHEFHHMIQIGSYGVWSTDMWMHEMTSTYFEEAVFPDTDDYRFYVRDFMKHTDRAFWLWPNGGYELALWPLFLERSHGPSVLRDTWTAMRRVEPFTAMSDAVRDHGGDMGADLCRFAQANYFTGYRADNAATSMYTDAASFPVPTSIDQRLTGPSATITGRIPPTGSVSCRVFSGLDTVGFVIANTDIDMAIRRDALGIGFTLEVRSDASGGEFTPLANDWGYQLVAESPNVLCLAVTEGGTGIAAERDLPFPNPYHPDSDPILHFPLPRSLQTNRADLYVFSSGMSLLVRREAVSITLDDLFGTYVGYDGRTDSGSLLPSGVYFYFLKYGTETRRGKFVVIRK